MGSNSAVVRGSIRVRNDVGLKDVEGAVSPFCRRWGIKLNTVAAQFGYLAPADDAEAWDDSEIALDSSCFGNGVLALYLPCRMGGSYPDGFDELCSGLERLTGEDGGTLEVIDLDTSPSNDDAICPVFIGTSDEARLRARFHYAFELAWVFVGEAVPRGVFESARDSCEAAARKALGTTAAGVATEDAAQKNQRLQPAT